MQTNLIPSDAVAAAVSYDNEWTKAARDGFTVQITWNWTSGGPGASGVVRDLNGGDEVAFSLDFGSRRAETLALVHAANGRGTFIDVTLSLRGDSNGVDLNCNIPIAPNEYFSDTIGHCAFGPGPGPDPYPDPGNDDGEVLIDAPANAIDLASFIWLRPLNGAQSADLALRFVRCDSAAVRTLYDGLTPEKKLDAASAFMAGTSFVQDIALLPAPFAQLPAARLRFLALPGEHALADLVAGAQDELAIASLPAFLQEPACAAAMAQIWQSIFALALVGAPAQSALANGLFDILRVFHYLTLLNDGLPALSAAAGRHTVLTARVAIPDSVATRPPELAFSGTGKSVAADHWEVLGAGMLKTARQHLAGYAAGELADVVNIMPRERQELLERSVTATSGHSREDSAHTRQDDSDRATSAASELADTVREVMAADGTGLDMAGIQPAYTNLNMVLNGTGSRSKARSNWSSGDSARMARRMTEQAAKRVGERIGSQRGKEWRELRERRQSQLIDNTGNERMVGVYRWVEQVVRVHVEERGTRMVLAFSLDQPALQWLASVAQQGPAPLQKPAPLPAAYDAVTAANYQALGAQYGLLGLEPPPPETVTISATVNQVTLGDLSLLCVPDGYAVTSAAITLAICDDSYNLACSVCGVEVPGPGATGTALVVAALAPLSTSLPNCSATGTTPAIVTPGARPTALVSTFTIASPLLTTGRIPLMVMSAAPSFAVSVVLSCSQVPMPASAASSMLTAWQLRIYQALQAAWHSAWQAYDVAMHARSELASAGQAAEVQRDTLRHACLGLLLEVAGKNGPAERMLAPALDGQHMTWQYQSPTSAAGSDWQNKPASEATRPSSARLFQRFLSARSAQVLLPVSEGWESDLLFYLQFQQLWIGAAAGAPVTESTVPLMEELLRPAPPAQLEQRTRDWTIRVPTSMIYLQQGFELPSMPGKHMHPLIREISP